MKVGISNSGSSCSLPQNASRPPRWSDRGLGALERQSRDSALSKQTLNTLRPYLTILVANFEAPTVELPSPRPRFRLHVSFGQDALWF